MDRWAGLGIKGIKVDFFDRETDERVQLMEDVYADCERLHLVANVHGANKPTGEVRTHPGILTREGIYGQEMGDLTAEQYTICLLYTSQLKDWKTWQSVVWYCL